MFRSAGNEQLGVADRCAYDASDKRSGVACGGDVAVIEHGVSVPTDPTAWVRLRLRKDGQDSIAVGSGKSSFDRDTRSGERSIDCVDVESTGHIGRTYAASVSWVLPLGHGNASRPCEFFLRSERSASTDTHRQNQLCHTP